MSNDEDVLGNDIDLNILFTSEEEGNDSVEITLNLDNSSDENKVCPSFFVSKFLANFLGQRTTCEGFKIKKQKR